MVGRSSDGLWHQFSADLGCGEEGNVIQYKQLSCDNKVVNSPVVLQLSYETAQLWNSVPVRKLWGKAPLARQLCPAPVWSAPLCSCKTPLVPLYFSSSQGNTVFRLKWKEKVCSPRQRERGAN